MRRTVKVKESFRGLMEETGCDTLTVSMRLTLRMGLVALFVSAGGQAQGAPGPCKGRGTSLVVLTTNTESALYLCAAGKYLKHYSVSLGREGTGQENLKTPIGTYTLGELEHSTEFGTFIPVDYATAEHAKKKSNGEAIGVHGPVRCVTWESTCNTWVDCTPGCIAIATDNDFGEVSRWVKENKPMHIHILKE